MQTLYAYEQNSGSGEVLRHSVSTKEISLQISTCKKQLDDKINQSSALFYLLLTYICNIAQYATADAKRRASKYLATDEDKNVNTRLADNKILARLWQDKGFQDQRTKLNIDHYIKEDWLKKLFKQLAETDEYQLYIQEKEHDLTSDKHILLFLWETIINNNESFLSDLSDDWVNWEDDLSLMKILIGNYFNKPSSINFHHFISEEKQEYAESLLCTVIERQEYLLQMIKPKLKNWEAERIAQIDMLLLKMGLSEFLYFPTIPAKVTINEYIDIAKDYSTDQSGQFVNGVLDNLRKDLLSENNLRKIERTK